MIYKRKQKKLIKGRGGRKQNNDTKFTEKISTTKNRR